jgi:hypothetical protein
MTGVRARDRPHPATWPLPTASAARGTRLVVQSRIACQSRRSRACVGGWIDAAEPAAAVGISWPRVIGRSGWRGCPGRVARKQAHVPGAVRACRADGTHPGRASCAWFLSRRAAPGQSSVGLHSARTVRCEPGCIAAGRGVIQLVYPPGAERFVRAATSQCGTLSVSGRRLAAGVSEVWRVSRSSLGSGSARTPGRSCAAISGRGW